MFAINTSPRGRELEEGIPNELCRVLDGVCVFVCVCVFSTPSKNTEKSLSPWAHCSPHVAACWPRFRRSGLFEQTVLWPLEQNVWGDERIGGEYYIRALFSALERLQT